MTNEIFKKILENMIVTCCNYNEIRAFIKGCMSITIYNVDNTTYFLFNKVLLDFEKIFLIEFGTEEKNSKEMEDFIDHYFPLKWQFFRP